MRISGPLYSMTAHGWLGSWVYRRHKIVLTPYPFGLFPRYLMSANYYSPLGWTYQMRRTWHGIVWVAERPPIGHNPRTPYQQFYRNVFGSGVKKWQSFPKEIKDIYKRLRYPVKASGYNRWLHYWMEDKRNQDPTKSCLE